MLLKIKTFLLPLEQSARHPAPVDVSAAAEAGDVHHPLDGGHAGQEVEGVAEQQRLRVGDRVHDAEVGHRLRPLLDLADVTDRQTVEEVHQDDHDQDDEGEEVDVAEGHEWAVEVDGDIREL